MSSCTNYYKKAWFLVFLNILRLMFLQYISFVSGMVFHGIGNREIGVFAVFSHMLHALIVIRNMAPGFSSVLRLIFHLSGGSIFLNALDSNGRWFSGPVKAGIGFFLQIQPGLRFLNRTVPNKLYREFLHT